MKFLKLMAVTLLTVSAGSLFAEGEVAQLASALQQIGLEASIKSEISGMVSSALKNVERKYKQKAILEKVAKNKSDNLGPSGKATIYQELSKKLPVLNNALEKQPELVDLLDNNIDAAAVLLDNEEVLRKLAEIDEKLFHDTDEVKGKEVFEKFVKRVSKGEFKNKSSNDLAQEIVTTIRGEIVVNDDDLD